MVTDFCADLTEGEELMPHQHGPIPVGLQVLFGISELAIHHDDVAVAAGHRYLPPARTLAVLGQLYSSGTATGLTAIAVEGARLDMFAPGPRLDPLT